MIIAAVLRAGGAGDADRAPQGHPDPLGPGPRTGGAPAAQPGRQRAGAGHRRVRRRRAPDWEVVTSRRPTDEEWRDLVLAWRVCGRTTSNAIAIVNDGQAVGVGAGQQSRVVAAEIAVRKAGERAKGGAAASDAFFPFPDGLLVLAAAGVTAVVQPGGSVRGRRGDRRGRRGRAGHGGHRRAALPALMAAHPARRRGGGRPGAGRGGRPGGPPGPRGDHASASGTVLVGTDGPSERYVAMKHADCAEVGMVSVGEQLPATATQAEVEEVVRRFNADPAVQRLPGAAPPARGPRRGARPAGRRSGQGRRRPAPGRTSAAWSWAPRARCPAPRRASSSCWRPTMYRWKVATW